jgi:hypothetical protein
VLNPRAYRLSGWFSDLKLHWSLRLLLHDNRTRRDAIPMGDVADAQLDKVAPAKFAVDREVE